METQQFFALFGESLFMDTVEASLADIPRVGIVRIHPSVVDLAHRLRSFQPDMVVVDLNAPNLHFVVSFLKERPGVPILGLDLSCSQAIVLTSRLYPAPTPDHLLAVVEHYVRGNGHDQAPSPALPGAAIDEI
jgi:hypothetical protein